MSAPRYSEDGTRLTDCCGAMSTFSDGELVCKVCWAPVPRGQGDGNDTICPDCGKATEYVRDQWRHVDPAASCFLYAARVEGNT